jgi:hypothetical protein
MARPRSLALMLLLTIAPAFAAAEDYRWEVKATFERDDAPGDAFGDVDILQLGGTWYFAPVATDGVPLAEAAFLGRASSVSAIAARFNLQFEALDDIRLNAQGARVGYYVPNTMFYVGVGASRGQTITALNSTIVEKKYVTQWFGGLGVAPLHGLLITTDFHEDGYDPNVTARYVGKLPNDHFYAGSVSLVDPDGGDTSFGLDFDYYFDESFSAGVGYEDGGSQWELRAEKFFSRSWALGVSASTADDGDAFGLQLTWRH